VIQREGKDIIIARIKIPVVSCCSSIKLTLQPAPTEKASILSRCDTDAVSVTTEKAFILRRCDTDAVSVTTMFAAAYPGATDEQSRRELEWVGAAHATPRASPKLAGVWVAPTAALDVADAYGLRDLVDALVRAVPDPNAAYPQSKRSREAAAEHHRKEEEVAGAPPTPKRRRAEQEEPATPNRAGKAEAKTPKSAAKATPKATPKSVKKATPKSAAKATPKRVDADEEMEDAEEEKVEEDEENAEGEAEEEQDEDVSAPAAVEADADAEIAAAKELVRKLKGDAQEGESESRGTKRSAEDDKEEDKEDADVQSESGSEFESDFKTEAAAQPEARAIVTNKRVRDYAVRAVVFGIGAVAVRAVSSYFG
jgi:hypothetical protein